MLLSRLSVPALLLAAASALLGCSQATDVSTEPVEASEAPILSGFITYEAKYDAVGAIAIDIPYLGFFDIVCSATLVGPTAIVTARHCTPWIDEAMYWGGTASMVFGVDAGLPDQSVPITSYVNAPSSRRHPGLLLDGGRDVAVAYLDSAPVGITPAKLGHFKHRMIGKKFEIAGYGYNDYGFYGLKFAGPATARADKGRWYRLLFNRDKDAFLEWYFTDAQTTPTAEQAEEWWDIYKLEPHYELLAGGLEGEALGCFGDSGGPLLRGTNAKNLTVYGVSFAVEASQSTICTRGGGYLVFNHHIHHWVKNAVKNAP